jgi:hypothetical protein
MAAYKAHRQAALGKGVAADSVSHTASSAFASAGNSSVLSDLADTMRTKTGATPTPVLPDLDENTRDTFADALPQPQAQTLVSPWKQEAPKREKPSSVSVTIQNQTLQADDCRTLFDFVRALMQGVEIPEAVAV